MTARDGDERLRVVPITLDAANEFVRAHHRHSRPTVGHKFAVGARRAGGLVGVAIAGRPVARLMDDGLTLEVLRVCTDGTRNACSILYAAVRRAARAMGYTQIITYTLPHEGGASLRAAGFRLDLVSAGGASATWHNRPGRTALPVGDDLVGGKWRWLA